MRRTPDTGSYRYFGDQRGYLHLKAMSEYKVNYSGQGISQYPITIYADSDESFWFKLSLFLGNGHMKLDGVGKDGQPFWGALHV